MSKIALLPGGFKPPHAGHYNMAKWLVANTDADTILIRVGSKERDGITREMSLALWDLYTQDDDNIIVNASEQNSPVRDVYDYIEQEAPEDSTVYLGMGEKDINDQRFNNIGKFAEPKGIEFETVLVPPQAGGVSGTEMRGFINNDDKESFQKYLPDHIDKDKAWDIVTDNLEEDFYDPRNKTVDFMRSSEYKAGMPDGHKDDINPSYEYHRAGVYGRMYETRGGEPEIHIYDFDETIARVEIPIPYNVKTPDGVELEGGETTSVEFEKKQKELKNSYDKNVSIEFNFKAFEKQIEDAIINEPVYNKLKNSLTNSNVKTTVLTARSIGHPVTRYLKNLGLDVYVLPLGMYVDGKVTGQDKADWIDKRIKKTTKKVYFIDDSEDNRIAVNFLKDKHPNVKFDIENPPEIEEMIGMMTPSEKRKHKKTLKIITRGLKKYNKGNKYFKVPKNWKGSLTRKYKRKKRKKRKVNEMHTGNNKYHIDNSNIQGIGAFANNNYAPGTIMGKLHDIPGGKKTGRGYDFYELGKSYNHSDTPNCENLLHNNTRYLVTIQPIKKGEELTANYRLQPELEQPDHFMNETKYGSQYLISQYEDKIKSDYGPQQYRNLQLMISQKQDEKVNNWLKTKGYLNETNVFSKEWWKKTITEHLLIEGGAAGHMAHPFNLSSVNSGKDLKDIFIKAADSLQNNPGAVKIDGVNSSIRLVDLEGKKQFVMDRGSKKPLDIKGITKADLEDRFKPGHGMVKVGGEVLDMFNEALPSLEDDLKKLGAWEDPNILFNMEYVSGKTNVQDYGSNFIAIHGLNKIESKEVQGKRGPLIKRASTEVSYDKSALQSMLDNLKSVAEKNDFEVYGSVPTEMKKKPNFNNALSKNYTLKFNEGEKTQTLETWLNELNDIPEDDFIFMNVDNSKKKVGAVSKQVYTTLLKGDNIDELFEDEEDKQKAIKGFTTYLATEKLGDEILKVLDSPMGSVENHEGVVIRDKNITTEPFKITGKFILGGMVSDF